MSKAKHTPGPWKCAVHWNALGYPYYQIEPVTIASVNNPNHYQLRREHVDNSYLIAAAPKLLEALEEGAACLKEQIEGSGGHAVEEVLEGMLEAIAKAKGE